MSCSIQSNVSVISHKTNTHYTHTQTLNYKFSKNGVSLTLSYSNHVAQPERFKMGQISEFQILRPFWTSTVIKEWFEPNMKIRSQFWVDVHHVPSVIIGLNHMLIY